MGQTIGPQRAGILQLTFFNLFFLFFLQLLTEFISAIYAFGLLKTSLTAEVLSVLLLLAPLALLGFRKPPSRRLLIMLGEAVVVCRAIVPLLPTRGIMFTAGLGTGLALVFFPGLLARIGVSPHLRFSRPLGMALSVSMALSILLRALGSGTDASMAPPFQILGWVLAAGAAVALPAAARAWPADAVDRPSGALRARNGSSLGVIAAGVGTMSVVGGVYFAFMAPNVIARWTATSYRAVVTLLLLSLSLLAIGLFASRPLLAGLRQRGILIWAAGFGLALVATIAGHQVSFPLHAGAYPFFPPAAPRALRLPLVLTLMLAPVIVISIMLFLQAIHRLSPSPKQLGLGFGAGALFLLGLIFAHIFTTVYDYIPVVGPLFRDRFWLVYLLLVLGIVLPLLTLQERDFDVLRPYGTAGMRSLHLIAVAALSTAAIPIVFLRAARPSPPTAPPVSLRVVTYNIQQGYDAAGRRNLAGQLELLRALDADLIGLHESDTNRISGGNADVVRFFADQLDMYSYYGPKTVNGTFGIALLSKLPLRDPTTFYMYSEGEQTASVDAGIEIEGGALQVLVTHLGNGGPLVQQQEVLSALDLESPSILMGDFNFNPGSEQYSLTASRLLDAWRLRWPRGMDDRGFQPDERIDHVFVSSGVTVDDIRFVTDPESDHPALFADLSW